MQTLIFKLGIFVSSKIGVLHCCMERQVMRSLYPKLLSTKVGCWYGSTEVPNLGLIPQQTLTAPQVGVFSPQLTHFSGSRWCQQDYRWSRCVVPALRFSWPVSWSGFLWGTVWEEYVPGQVERGNNSWKLQVSRLLWKYCFFHVSTKGIHVLNWHQKVWEGLGLRLPEAMLVWFQSGPQS